MDRRTSRSPHRFDQGTYLRFLAILAVVVTGRANADPPPTSPSATASAAATVLSVAKAPDGDRLVFVVTIQRPADMGEQSIERWERRPSDWPRVAQLASVPPAQYPCYLEYVRRDRWDVVTVSDRLTFVGRGPAVESIELSLRYPGEDGTWKQAEVSLDLATAETLEADPSPRQRWAEAQAMWFVLLRDSAGDVGGFLTYAAHQTRRSYGLIVGEADTFLQSTPGSAEIDQYTLLSGALAIQESLQFDRMTNTNRDRSERSVVFADIPAVAVKSHPFDEMRGEAEPIHGRLAALVPEDHYFLRFRSVDKLLELLDTLQQWGGSLLRLASPVGTTHNTRERTMRQLCLPEGHLAPLLGPAVVREVAVAGSDPYIVNGSDVTVLFQATSREAFHSAVDGPFREAQRVVPGAVLDEVEHRGIRIERLVQPERVVSCHRCWIDDVCIYSNSLAALRRTIDAATGAAPNLAAAPDFQYVRAVVFPLDDSAEDGFLYLSDSFVRRLVGPEVRIKQKRRLEAATSLKMLANAAMFHGYEHGPGRPTFEQLVAARSLNADDLFDPEGGTFTWDAERAVASSSTWGRLEFLTPLVEVESASATKREVEEYGRFRDRYQQYWRQYFDPIAIRLKLDRTIRVETCILPLIDASRYNELVDIAGGEPITVDTSRFGRDTLLRYVMHLNDGPSKSQATGFLDGMTGTNLASDWIGEWATFWIEDTDAFGKLVRREYGALPEDAANRRGDQAIIDVFNASFVVGIHARNKLSLAAFLVALRSMISTSAPNTVIFRNLEPYHNVTIVQIAPDPTNPFAQELIDEPTPTSGPAASSQSAVSERGPALYYATIEDGFYVSTQASALRHLIDVLRDPPAARAPSASEKANVLLYVAPGAAEKARPTISFILEQKAREVSLRNLAQVWLLGRCGLLEDARLDEVAPARLGYRLVCPNGGAYTFDPHTASVASSIYGPLDQPMRLDALPAESPLNELLDDIETVTACLRFTKEGLMTQIDIVRR